MNWFQWSAKLSDHKICKQVPMFSVSILMMFFFRLCVVLICWHIRHRLPVTLRFECNHSSGTYCISFSNKMLCCLFSRTAEGALSLVSLWSEDFQLMVHEILIDWIHVDALSCSNGLYGAKKKRTASQTMRQVFWTHFLHEKNKSNVSILVIDLKLLNHIKCRSHRYSLSEYIWTVENN